MFIGGNFHHKIYLTFGYICIFKFLNKRLGKKALFSCICPNERIPYFGGPDQDGASKSERSHPLMLDEAIERKPKALAAIRMSRWRHAEMIEFESVIRALSMHSLPAPNTSAKCLGLRNPHTLRR